MYQPDTKRLLLVRIERRLAELRKEYKDPEATRSKQSILLEARSLIKTKKRLETALVST